MQNANQHNSNLTTLYNQALHFTKSHYENFPVISFFVPKHLRKFIAVVYQFARQADDIADEGNFTEAERLDNLQSYNAELQKSFKGEFESDFWKVFNDTIFQNKLSVENFSKLLKAFEQDLSQKKYEDYEDLLQYCQNSANPVGRIILEIYDVRNNDAIKFSDSVCTALQLTNFYQDVKIDLEKGRVYIPQNEIKNFSFSNEQLFNCKPTQEFIELMKFQIERTRKLFFDGRKILPLLPFRLKFQILVTIKGGEAILKKIEDINYDILNHRPKLTKFDFTKLFFEAIILRR
ncbi:MAG: squalene synthase HpnC [Ignavibacteriae bacterium]|nr:squalene synthase HpnC [Ignavibacteriota bacterium]